MPEKGGQGPLGEGKERIEEGKGEEGDADKAIHIEEGGLEPLKPMAAHCNVFVPQKEDDEQDAQVVERA